jgi:hypothetical protein
LTPEVARALAEAGPWAVVLFIGGTIGIVLWRLHDAEDKRCRERELFWRNLALEGMEAAEHGTELADRATAVARRKRRDG